jgi:AraC family transcriptional regulator, transcriptional activator of pobA
VRPHKRKELSLVTQILDFCHSQSVRHEPNIRGMARRARRRYPTYFLYGEAPRQAAGPLLHVETIEARSARHHWKIDPHRHHALHQLVFVLKGCGVTMADGLRAQFRPPALVLTPAGTVHGFEFEPWTSGYVISISDQLLRELIRHEPGIEALFSHPLTLELTRDLLRATDFTRSVAMLARELLRSDDSHRIALQGWLRVLLGNALRLVEDRPHHADPSFSQSRTLLARFAGMIERRFRNDQGVPDYADALGVSQSRLRTVCLALTGQSPIQMIHARILLEAKRQLHYTDSAVKQIANSLGFEDAAYFTRFFSRRSRMSPREFRRRGPELISSGGKRAAP